MKKEQISEIDANIVLNPYLIAPIKKDSILGNLNIFSKNEQIANFNLLSSSDIDKTGIFDYILIFFKYYPNQLENSVF